MRWILGLCLACLALSVADRQSAALWAAERPNVVLIMVDDFGYECVGANGSTSYRTPVLDRLAASGMRGEQCHVQPLCTSTRVQLMTGQYNVRNYTHFGHLEPNQTTFAQLFQKAGYATCIAGKWQLGRDLSLPARFGFDRHCLWQLSRRPPRYANPGLEIDGVEKDFTHGEYGPDLVNRYAIDFIASHKDRPFLLYYPMMLTHAPFQPTPDSPDWNPKAEGEKVNQDPRHFADMVTYADKLIGQLVDSLEQQGLREKTLVIVLGDNGTKKGHVSQQGTQTVIGGKGTPLTTGTHVPLIVNWPGHVAPRVLTDLVDSTDFLPTICEAAGIQAPTDLTLDGRSFLPQALGQPGQPREWIYCWYGRSGGPKADDEFAMNGAFKLYRDGRLFDLKNDAGERLPLDSEQLTAQAQAARQKLAEPLEKYRDARPAAIASQTGPRRGSEE